MVHQVWNYSILQKKSPQHHIADWSATNMLTATCPNCQHVFQQPCNHHHSGSSTTSMCGGQALQCSVTLRNQLPVNRSSMGLHSHSGGGLVQPPDVTVMLATSQPCHLTLGLPYPSNVRLSTDQLSPTSAAPSPSLPFTFIIPPVSSWLTSVSMDVDEMTDLQCIQHSIAALRQSVWYHENISWVQAAALLKKTVVGTFLIRDSSDPHFLFSLSVQTDRGPTSVRIHYLNGKFRLDAEERVAHLMPYFKSVIELVSHYVRQGSSKKTAIIDVGTSSNQVWVDGEGKMYSPVTLTKPLLKTVPTLQHLCRTTIHSNPSIKQLSSIPFSLKNYLAEYPYQL